MIEFELDGKPIKAEDGSTILEVALKAGKYIPHFCYHKKLSIAANCRMCLVEVEKARGPVPACATPISEGMKVHTCSKLAVEAQKGVMEFLLINHPLDCPICDQGGECQLQDLAVGYGKGTTRFNEAKRAVSNKELGPLIKTEMTRCIHCSRCVRFSEEIAGVQELGMSYRNNHVEVMPFWGEMVTSELSGNMIDLCPVGALTSKPFRDTARSWELSRRKSISPHSSLGANIQVHINKYHQVVRVLPIDNEAVNECWISDKDRFSYEGLYHNDRVKKPMIKQDGKWIEVDWEAALTYAAKSINGVKKDHGADKFGVLASPTSTIEELYLLQKLMHQLDIQNLDYRLDQSDFSGDYLEAGASHLGFSLNELNTIQSLLIVGSNLVHEEPLVLQRLRQRVKNGLELFSLNLIKEDWGLSRKLELVADSREFEYFLAQILKTVVELTNSQTNINLNLVDISENAKLIGQSLLKNKGAIVLGKIARGLKDYNNLRVLANEIARICGGTSGVLPSYANEVGANIIGFVPYKTAFNQAKKQGLNVKQMLAEELPGYLLLNTELELDAIDSQLALKALHKAETVVVMSAYFNSEMKEYADVILPITPFTETAGSYVNLFGLWQQFNGVTKPLEESKPGWKVIRVLANQLGFEEGFSHNSIQEVRAEILELNDTSKYLNNQITVKPFSINKPNCEGLVRYGFSGIYQTDSITRRANSLQQTQLAYTADLVISRELANQLQIVEGQELTIKQTNSSAKFTVSFSAELAANVVLLPKTKKTIRFANSFGACEVIK